MSKVRFPSTNLGAWPEIRARTEGPRVALVVGAERLTYAELAARVARVAGGLREHGVAPGDRVAVALKNRTEFVEMLFATARLGAIFVPLNFRLSAEEVAYALSDSGARIVVAQEATRPAVESAVAEAGLDVPVAYVDGADPGYPAWRQAEPVAEPALVEPSDPLSIIYTSGTTGPPKGAIVTHGSVMANTLNYLIDWDLRRDDATLVVNPIFHVVLYIFTVPLLLKGGKVVLMEDFDAAQALRIAEEEKVTVWFAIPTAWQMMLDAPEFAGTDLSGLRLVGSGGMAAPGPLMDRFAELGWPYRQGYGLTESGSAGTTMRPEDQAEHRGSIGRPFFSVEARVVDDEGRDVPPGVPGEILMRGPSMAVGYWNKPEETAAAWDAEGWFRTGDIATQDADGFLRIVDRKKDLIISGGENISSLEVEQAVQSHPAVRETAVIGVPHDRWGESPCAVVVLRPGSSLEAGELIAHCRELIAHYKCPTSMVVVDELPKTANGKISKLQVRATAAAVRPDIVTAR